MSLENIAELVGLIEQQTAKRILLQLPDGLRQYATQIADKLQEKSIQTIISGSPCYGACCLAEQEAIDTKSDLLVHIGHNDFGFKDMKKTVPVLFYPWKLQIEFTKLDVSKIKQTKLGLVSTVQYMDELDKIQNMLKERETTILGQTLGCMTPDIPKDIEAIVYLGTGQFHPTAFTSIPVYRINPKTGDIDIVEKDENIEQKKKAAALSKLDDANTVGILVSSYPGQSKIDQAMEIKEKMEKIDKKPYIIYINEINEKTVQELDIDAFINTACPRIRQDYLGKPIINSIDLK
tara:strand:+ start:986 stop:1861 length:876 start_codon:yes stop_codon:yes gene_type:complete